MNVRFWGVRGSVAVSGSPFVHTGGNTTCVEIEHAGHRLILDGGTGLASLGNAIGSPTDATLLFTHVHWDHIQGVPFFSPLFHPDSRIRLCGMRSSWGSLRDALDAQMRPPQFPIGIDQFNARMQFDDIDAGHPFDIGPFVITPALMDHPDGVLVYKIQAANKTVVFATDVEHGSKLDNRLLRFVEGADLLIHDAQYTEREYLGEEGPSRVGWGHSTWNQAVGAGRLAGAKQLALFHHDPCRTDDGVAVIEAHAQQLHSGAFAAREGMLVSL